MRIVVKTLLGLVVALVMLIAALGITSWHSNSVPKRPANVPSSAIWVRAPLSPLDYSRSGGAWVACWVDGQFNRCIVAQEDGTVECNGLFLPYKGVGPVPKERLRYRIKNTAYLWVDLNVPIISLQDGDKLLPVERYHELKTFLDKHGGEFTT